MDLPNEGSTWLCDREWHIISRCVATELIVTIAACALAKINKNTIRADNCATGIYRRPAIPVFRGCDCSDEALALDSPTIAQRWLNDGPTANIRCESAWKRYSWKLSTYASLRPLRLASPFRALPSREITSDRKRFEYYCGQRTVSVASLRTASRLINLPLPNALG